MTTPPNREALRAFPARLWARIDNSNADGCWPWLGRVGSARSNYGRINVGGRQLMAHRVVWELVNGPIPSEMTLDHLCRNTLCCNPAHLEVVTRGENARRYTRLITHCPQGHAYDEANTIIRASRMTRECRICKSVNTLKAKRRRRQLRPTSHAPREGGGDE